MLFWEWTAPQINININGHSRIRFIGGTDSIYKAYIRPMYRFQGISPENMALYGTNVPPINRILEFPLWLATPLGMVEQNLPMVHHTSSGHNIAPPW